MAFVHSKQSRLILGAASFSGYLSSWEVANEIELSDVTVFIDEGHRNIPGLNNGTLTLGGFVDNSAASGGQDETLHTALGAADGTVVTAAPDGLATGNRVITIEARESTYADTSEVAEAVSFEAEWMAEGRVDTGVALHDLTAESGSTFGTGVDNGASTANGGVGVLHVTAASGTTPTLDATVQHSADDVTYVDLVTFTQATAATAERVDVTSTVNQYLRAEWTTGGTTPSFTFAVAFARR